MCSKLCCPYNSKTQFYKKLIYNYVNEHMGNPPSVFACSPVTQLKFDSQPR